MYDIGNPFTCRVTGSVSARAWMVSTLVPVWLHVMMTRRPLYLTASTPPSADSNVRPSIRLHAVRKCLAYLRKRRRNKRKKDGNSFE